MRSVILLVLLSFGLLVANRLELPVSQKVEVCVVGLCLDKEGVKDRFVEQNGHDVISLHHVCLELVVHHVTLGLELLEIAFDLSSICEVIFCAFWGSLDFEARYELPPSSSRCSRIEVFADHHKSI